MKMKKLNELNIKEAAEGLKKGDFTAVQLTKACLDEIKAKDKEINAFITVTEELALRHAEESDQRRQEGETVSDLDGIPCAIKDVIAVKDYVTTAGSKMLENYIPPEDAFVVQKLKESGAVILGKTNTDEFASGGSTETSYFGVTKNPIDTNRVPGGSSGGSAAAVAANMCIYALGSDTGGSIRQPAAYCGIVGLKPTYGAVSRNGLFPLASSLDQIGPMTKTVEDASTVLGIISSVDPGDSTSVGLVARDKTIKRVGVLKQTFSDNVQANIKESIVKEIEKLKQSGIEVQEVDLPVLDYSINVYYIIMPVEGSSNLGRYDGVKYGHVSLAAKDLMETYQKSRGEGFGEEVKRRIVLGAYASSEGYKDQYYGKAQKVRAVIKKELDKAFEKYDCLIVPTTPTTAFKIGENTDDPVKMYLEDIFTVPANIAGIPALSIPIGLDENGLPIGLQIMGPEFSEDKILALAKLLEEKNG